MSGPSRPPLRVRDTDSVPNVIPVNTIIVSDGDLVDDGGATVTIDTTGAATTPAGSDTEIQFNDGGAFGASSQLKYQTGASLGRMEMATGSSATLAEIRAMSGHGLKMGSSDVTASAIRSYIDLYGENDAPSGVAIISTATGGTVWIKTTGTGATEIGNETTNQDTTLQVAGNGTGKPIINLKNDTMAASLEVTTDEELSIKGGTDLFKFDVSSATGAMTFPDGTTQNTAATGGVTFPLEGDDDSAAAPNYSWSSATNSGLFRLTGTTIGIAVAGSAAMYFQSSKVEANKRFEVLAGTAAAPSLMFGGDNDTGLYSLAANKIGLTTGGVVRLGIGDAGDILVGGTAAGTDGQVLTSGGAGAAVAWEDAGGGATELSGLSDVLINATNWVNGFLIQPNSAGSAPTTGTLSSASNNIGLGADVFKSITTADRCFAMGEEAAVGLTTGADNVVIGAKAMSLLPGVTTGTQRHNVAIGTYCMQNILNGAAENVGIGSQTLNTALSGEGNTAVGTFSGDVTSGNRNLMLGVSSGNTISTGSDNVVLGGLDVDDGTADNQLVIASGDGTPFWIKGDSAGSCYQGDNASTWSVTSDQKLKREIVDSVTGLDAINAVQVRNFRYIEKAEPIIEIDTDEDGKEHEQIIGYDGENRYNLDPEPQRVGVIAQELQEVFPEAVTENALGHLTVNTDSINWALLKAVQELSAKVEVLEESA